MKRLLVLFLLPVFIFQTYADTSEWIRAANFLASQWVITDNSTNPDGYRLGDTITRKETMKIVAKLAGATPVEKCEGKFSDVENDWGCKYIEWALGEWYIAANATFRPNDNITIAEALKLIFKARGIEKKFNTGNWQMDYYNTALEVGLITGDDDNGNPNADAKRGWIFFACANDYSEFDTFIMTDEVL